MKQARLRFLIDKMVQDGVASYQISQTLADDLLLSSFEVGDISPIALMFQTGYLTINSMQASLDGTEYCLLNLRTPKPLQLSKSRLISRQQ